MLDERTRRSFARSNPGTSAVAAAADTRDWVAEFRREQAHLIRTAPGAGASRLLSYGVGGALAVALAVTLTTVLPVRPSGSAAPGDRPVSVTSLARAPATELAEAREEGLTFDLARARQEVEAARAAHAQDVGALRAAHAREIEGLRAAAAEAAAGAGAKGNVLAHDLETARAGLAAAQRQAAEADAQAAEGRGRSEQLARQLAEAEAWARESRADVEAALAQAARERDEARARLAETAQTTPPRETAAPGSEPVAAPLLVDWALFSLRLSPAEEAPTSAPPILQDPRRTGSDQKASDQKASGRKAGNRARGHAPVRNDPAPRADRPGRTKAGATRAPAPPGDLELRLPGGGLIEPDA
ncbi:hypothetical protein GCM10007886_09880 [Methylobacterium gregans]|uniref:hypothetical protein n=1 Tax=Methylobacterium gregans TaxID=374424 RepID=UPI00235DA18C|nr:hypothetical protein [Methylobacterium gregans]GLS52805.1 hypothetical protein GCM10007886_09880 [Methylobacterium gregans]